MNEVNTTALLERVNRLERQNKLIKLAGIVVALVMAFVLLVGAKEKVPKEIVAKGFRVVDTKGKTRAALAVTPKGPALFLSDENEKLRASLTVTQEGPILALYDENGKSRVFLAVTQESPGLALYDKKGKMRAELDVLSRGPALRFYHKKGKGGVSLVVASEGAGLGLFDKRGKIVKGFGIYEETGEW